MKIGIPKERHPKEKRVAGSPDTVKKLVSMGLEVLVEKDAGHEAMMLDREYQEAGAEICPDAQSVFSEADIIIKVQRPLTIPEIGLDEMALLRPGQILIGKLDALLHRNQVQAYADKKVTTFALELVPRITRAQNLDILSSQSNVAGYKIVMDAAGHFGRMFPMMMTAAGTIAPAKVLVLGAGVAGLQAIATAKRLGATVMAFDVRPAVKEEVQSLGAKFIEVPSEETASAETEGGYAREMSKAYKQKQAELIHETAKKADIILTTALIPGKPAPVLVNEDMVKDMKPGSVIVDLAAEAGGNCPLCEMDSVVVAHDVTILSYENVPARVPVDASALYAKNLLNFITVMIDKETKAFKLDMEDEIIQGTLVSHEGQIVHSAFKQEGD
ncbi:MAG: Re/Si-specific NAD(P)(+) transhydrogenase subunit alpha [Desulfobacteraceae bacterium]|jgi:NAD(P) transhydrogenase subunit alpha